MTEGATYFVMQSPRYGEYLKDEWLVFAARDDHPNWWQLVARFTEERRAQTYANIENDSQITEADPVPSDLSIPPSALEKIAELKTGNIFAVPQIDAAPESSGYRVADFIVPGTQITTSSLKPKSKAKKKANAHFPSDKWDEPATKRLKDLRAEGKPFGVISKILDAEFPGRGYTKAACTGKADRLGLPKPFDPKDEAELEDISPYMSDVLIEEANNETTEKVPVAAVETRLENTGSQSEDGNGPQSLALVNEAIRWYRTLAHAVYKMKDGTIQVDHGEFLLPAEFLALVNPERERMSLPPFVEQQEAAD